MNATKDDSGVSRKAWMYLYSTRPAIEPYRTQSQHISDGCDGVGFWIQVNAPVGVHQCNRAVDTTHVHACAPFFRGDLRVGICDILKL